MGLLAFPVAVLSETVPDTWQTCQRNDDCIKIDNCSDDAMNKTYLEAFNKKFRGCDGSAILDPQAYPMCVNSNCVITHLAKQEKKQR
jgi:hypothetical protein